MAMDTFIQRFILTQVNAAKEASMFIGNKYNEKTIQYWHKDSILITVNFLNHSKVNIQGHTYWMIKIANKKLLNG